MSNTENNQLIEEITAVMKQTKDKRMYERYLAVQLHLKGQTYGEIASTVGRTSRAIGNYIRAYKRNGLDGLNIGHPPGRSRKLTPNQEKEVCLVLTEKRPEDVGFPAEMNWTSPLLCKWIKQTFDVTYSERGVRSLLYRLGFSFTMPTYSLAKADPEKQEAFKVEFEHIKKTP